MAKTAEKKEYKIVELEQDEYPERFKDVPQGSTLCLVKCSPNVSLPPVIEGLRHFGTDEKGFYYLKS